MDWIKENWKIILMATVIAIGIYMLGAMSYAATALAADKGGPRARIADSIPKEVIDTSDRWSSCGVGVVGGKAWTETFIFESSDWTAGVQAFCDGKIPNTNLVVFGKVDYRLAGISQQGMQEADRQWSAVVGLGLLLSPATKLYAGIGHTELDAASLGFGLPNFDKGLTLVGGLETFITKNITLGGEYRNVDLGDAGGIISSSRSEFLLSVNYRF